MDATKRPLMIPPSFSTYAEKHGIFQLLERLLQKVIITQPADPLSFIIDFLKQENDDVNKIIVYGPPVSGKRQMSKMIVKKFGGVHITLDKLLNESELTEANKAKECLNKEQHIPSSLLVPVLGERLQRLDCQTKGWILEGFPQTRDQALAMQVAGIMPKHFVLLDASDSVLIERCLGKRIDPITGDVYHILFYPPDDAIVADRLEQPQNCSSEDVAKQLATYHRHIDGILECYQKVAKKINADRPISDVFAQVHSFLCTKIKSNAPITPRIVLLGPTGSGKSLQASLLSEKYKLVNVCVDSLIKEAIVKESKLGNAIKLYAEKGVSTPDSLMFQLVQERICLLDCVKKGWILHGYPRSREQAARLVEEGIAPNRVFILDICADSILERLTLRGTDPITGERYHMHYNPPHSNEIVNRLRTHPDDKEEAILKRLSLYQVVIDEISDYFEDVIQRINADQDPHTVMEILEAGIIFPFPKRPETPL